MGARFEAEGWAWRDATAAAEDARQEGEPSEAYDFDFGFGPTASR